MATLAHLTHKQGDAQAFPCRPTGKQLTLALRQMPALAIMLRVGVGEKREEGTDEIVQPTKYRVSKNAVFGLNFLPGFWTRKYRL